MWILSWAKMSVPWSKNLAHVLRPKKASLLHEFADVWKQPLSHVAQINFLSLLCLLWWTFNWEKYLKILGHFSHCYDFWALWNLSFCLSHVEFLLIGTGSGVAWSGLEGSAGLTSMRTSWEEGPFRDPSWDLEVHRLALLLWLSRFSKGTPSSSGPESFLPG